MRTKIETSRGDSELGKEICCGHVEGRLKPDLRLNGVSIQQVPGQLELTNVKAIDGYWRAQIDPAGLVVKSADTGPEDQISLVTKLDVELRLSTRRKRFY